MTPKERASIKIKSELQKDIREVIEIAKSTGLGELLFYFHYLHFTRLILRRDDIPELEKRLVEIYVYQAEEAFKYLIQCLYKHGKKVFEKNEHNGLLINPITTQTLTKYVVHINSKYESQYFLTLFSDLEVFGERDQHVKVNLNDLNRDDKIRRFHDYGLRVNLDNDRKKAESKTQEDFLNYFLVEYGEYGDLFEIEFGISLEKFVSLVEYLVNTITQNMQKKKGKFVKLDDERIDVQAYGTILTFGLCLLLKEDELYERFGEQIRYTVNKLAFKVDEFNEYQLRYNLSARQPLFRLDEMLLVSPELLLDSLFVNTHYSLLESKSVKEEYKKRYSLKFVESLAKMGNKCGYKEVGRNIQLYEGDHQIGDIDLALSDSLNGHFILIEAKNHALPLDVYFHDVEATAKRLDYLRKEWEERVHKRCEHVRSHYQKYGISNDFTYLIVTRFPEILSHFSEYLVLSSFEYDFWLKNYKNSKSFDELFKLIYDLNKLDLSEEQLQMLNKDLLSNWQFAKE